MSDSADHVRAERQANMENELIEARKLYAIAEARREEMKADRDQEIAARINTERDAGLIRLRLNDAIVKMRLDRQRIEAAIALLREAIDSHAPNRLNPIVAMRIIETLGGEP